HRHSCRAPKAAANAASRTTPATASRRGRGRSENRETPEGTAPAAKPAAPTRGAAGAGREEQTVAESLLPKACSLLGRIRRRSPPPDPRRGREKVAPRRH